MLHLILWRVFSALRRVLVAPLLALVLDDLTQLPPLALALTLGPFSLPLAASGVLPFDWWVWYVVLVAWASDMAYFAYFVESERTWSDRARSLVDSLRWDRYRVATDGGDSGPDHAADQGGDGRE